MIWLIAGTYDGRLIGEELLNNNYKLFVTTATDYGKIIFGEHKNLKIFSNIMNNEEMINFIKNNKINIVIDASHPYAIEVSNNAINAADYCKIKYIRYERKSIDIENVIRMNNYDEIAKYLENTKGNILLTIGSKNIEYFKSIKKERIFLRVLSSSKSILKCEESGFLPDNIISMKGIFSKEFNKSLFKELNIKYLVTKDSGEEGGFLQKIEAAKESGIEVIILKKPEINYPEIYFEKEKIINKVKELENG